ncbi:MAG: hypothetical protein ACKPJD_09255 [Planctomycetaceae bacterium]
MSGGGRVKEQGFSGEGAWEIADQRQQDRGLGSGSGAWLQPAIDSVVNIVADDAAQQAVLQSDCHIATISTGFD